MKLLFLSLFILSSCNPLKSLSDGETSLDDNFFDGGNVESLSNDLLSFWRLEESGTTEDRHDSNNINNFQHSLGNLNSTNGKRGNGFDCNSIVSGTNTFSPNTTTNMNFGLSQDFTVSLWVKAFAGTSGYLFHGESGTGYTIQILSNNEIDVWVNSTSSSPSSTILNYGQWHHIVVLFDRDSGVSIYKDGAFSEFQAVTFNGTSFNDNNVWICSDNAYSQVPNAGIDSVGVWGRLLTQEEINGLYYGNNNLD